MSMWWFHIRLVLAIAVGAVVLGYLYSIGWERMQAVRDARHTERTDRCVARCEEHGGMEAWAFSRSNYTCFCNDFSTYRIP